MAKEFELNMAYLGFVQEITQHASLIDVLSDIGDDYEPRQKEPISKLLIKIGDLSTIFLGCLTTDKETVQKEDAEAAKPRLLAEKIQETHKIVQKTLADQATFKQ